MKTRTLACALLLGACGVLNAQDWNTGGNFINLPTEYLGCDALSTQPLRLRTQANQPIDWYTNAIHRLRLWENQTNTINSLTNISQNGFVGISDQPLFFDNSVGAFSRLHLVDRGAGTTNFGYYAQQLGYRRWQRNGVTFTGNSDQGYVGQKYLLDGNNAPVYDKSDMVLQWSNDVQGEDGPDRLRFLFTSSRDGVSTHGSASEEGLEAMRFTPVDAATINAGLGDFYRGNIIDPLNVTEPTERLDILNGRLRIRELPTSPAASTLTQFLVTDANGVIHWRNVPTSPGGPGCEWTLVGTGNANVATAYAGNPGCPQADRRVGIGTNSPQYKLDVVHSSANGGGIGGQRVQFTGPSTGWAKGIDAFVLPLPGSSLQQVTGVHGEISGVDHSGSGVSGKATAGALDGIATSVSGVSGLAYGPNNGSTVTNIHGLAGESIGQTNGNVTSSFGVYGKSSGSNIQRSYGAYGYGLGGTVETFGSYFWGNGPSGSTTYGVYGRATGGTTNWSGFFAGNVQIQGNLFNGTTLIFSDAALKTEVDQIGPVGQQLAALRPKRYRYSDAAQERMNLSDGVQFGFIAQEVQEVLPELVSSTTLPAVLDSLGNEVSPEMAVNAVNYNSIIPLLVAGYQEQMSTINELRDRLSEMEHQLASCCANPDGVRSLPPGNTEPTGLGYDPTGTDKLRIQPNPFNERTTVYYTVDRGGRTQLLANSSDGRELRVLQEATLEAGTYQFEWDTASLAPGMYYVTLLLDGQPVVKKAVKVDR